MMQFLESVIPECLLGKETKKNPVKTGFQKLSRSGGRAFALAGVAKSFHDFLLEFSFRDVKLEYFLGRKHL